MFIKSKKNKFKYVDANPKDSLVKQMDAGVYNVNIKQVPFAGTFYSFEGVDIFEKGKVIDTGIYKKARKKIYRFLTPEMKKIRKMLGLRHKLSVIFNGKPGTGKTFLAGQLASELAKQKNALAFIITDNIKLSKFIDMIREQDPKRFIILILDEFEKIYDFDYGNISKDLLAFLDGSKSKNNVITIATVNSVGRLPKVLTERPGRFEEIYDFSVNEEKVLKVMIESVIPETVKKDIDDKEIFEEMKKNKVYSMDKLVLLIRDKIYDLFKKEKTDVKVE